MNKIEYVKSLYRKNAAVPMYLAYQAALLPDFDYQVAYSSLNKEVLMTVGDNLSREFGEAYWVDHALNAAKYNCKPGSHSYVRPGFACILLAKFIDDWTRGKFHFKVHDHERLHYLCQRLSERDNNVIQDLQYVYSDLLKYFCKPSFEAAVNLLIAFDREELM